MWRESAARVSSGGWREAGGRDQRSGVSSCQLVRDRTSRNEVRIIARNKHLATWRASSVRQTTPSQVNIEARNIRNIPFISRLSKTWEQRPQLISPEIAPWGKLCLYFLVLYWGFVLVTVKLQWPNVLPPTIPRRGSWPTLRGGLCSTRREGTALPWPRSLSKAEVSDTRYN